MLEEYEQADLVEFIREEFRHRGELTEGQIRKLCERKTDDYRKIDLALDKRKNAPNLLFRLWLLFRL